MLSTHHPRSTVRPRPEILGRPRRAGSALLAVAILGLSAFWSPISVSAQVAAQPLTLSTTVYAGRDGGAGCPGDERVDAVASTAVTWCFDLHNASGFDLADVSLAATGLDIDETDLSPVGGGSVTDALALLPNGDDLHLYYESEMASSLLTVTTATGLPADQVGDPVPGADPVVAEDGAGVALTSVAVEKTVYSGHDAGARCPGDEQVVGDVEEEITFCFSVANVGDTTLAPVTVDDLQLGLSHTDMTVLSGDLSSMAPGDTAVLYVESTIEGDQTNTVIVNGTAVDDGGDPIVVDGGPVTAEDTARVDEGGPALSFDKGVYRSHDGGSGCPGEELVKAVHDAAVTYCFSVVNSGDATLAPVTVDDPELGLTQTDMTVLSGDLSSMAPGDTAVLYLESTVDGDLTNTATVEGTVVDDAGDPVPGVDPVVLEDTAEVQEVTAALSLATEVLDPYTDAYVDADADAGTAGSNDGQPATLAMGATATFRFTVTNESDVDLSEVTVDAPQCDESPAYLDGDEGESDVLEPDEVWQFGCDVGDVQQGFTLLATADAVVDGDPDALAPDGAGKAEYAQVQVAAVGIETKVQDPDTGDFGDTAVLDTGSDAVFQVVVHNLGDAPLGEVVVDDEEAPECAHAIDGVLAAGESTAAYECTESAVDGGFVNATTVRAVPVDDEGDQVADPVTAEASAVVTNASAATAELAIDKSLAAAEPGGGSATWQITVSNNGALDATEPLVVVDEMPVELELISATGSDWVCQEVPAGVRCATDADLAPGAAAAPLILDTRVTAAAGTTVANVAYIEGTDGPVASDDAVLSVSGTNGAPTDTAGQTPSGTLPRTGAAALLGLVALGALLVGTGSLLTTASRRR